ncbi:MAG: amylo-alpha-1,6-glucosidase, partial [Candidatus Binataceae bacterium]
VYGDGSQVSDPIAPCEAQGYVFASRQQFSQVLWALGKKEEAKRLHDGAIELRKRFNEAYWMEKEDIFAMGLDGEGRQIQSVSSNPGHCLGTGVAEESLAARTVNRLMRDDMFSGWGVRTLSSGHPAYNPYSYHRGTVWPVEQGAFAIGFWRYGKYEEMLQLCRAQFELAELFEHFRLPEVLSGHQRDSMHPFPALYPDANSPQAWSASAVFAMIGSILGIFPLAPFRMLLVDPHLPEWLPEIMIGNLQVGEASVSLRFFRETDGASQFEIRDLKGDLRVEKRSDPWSLTSCFGDELRDRIAGQ